MRAVLTLDDDVAALLERTRRERGKSLDDLANELLRATLRRLSGAATKGSARVEAKAVEPATASPADCRATSAPYRIRPFSSGRSFLADLDNTARVLAWAEGESFR